MKRCVPLFASAMLCLYVAAAHGMSMDLTEFSGYTGDFSAYSPVLECRLGESGSKTVSLLKGDAFYRGHFYAIDLGDGVKPVGAFFTYNREDERDFGKSYADEVYAGCPGADEKVLVLYGGFAGNRGDSLALRYNGLVGAFETVHLRTKARPDFVYLNQTGMLLIVHEPTPTGADAWHVGQSVSGTGQIDPDMVSGIPGGRELPDPKGYAVIPVTLTEE